MNDIELWEQEIAESTIIRENIQRSNGVSIIPVLERNTTDVVETTVTYYDNLVKITKENGNFLVVAFKDNIVVVFDPTDIVEGTDEPYIALVRQMDNGKDAYEKWLHIIGKFAHKTTETQIGKYFDKPHDYKWHLTNGKWDGSTSTKKKILNLVNDSIKKMKSKHII